VQGQEVKWRMADSIRLKLKGKGRKWSEYNSLKMDGVISNTDKWKASAARVADAFLIARGLSVGLAPRQPSLFGLPSQGNPPGRYWHWTVLAKMRKKMQNTIGCFCAQSWAQREQSFGYSPRKYARENNDLTTYPALKHKREMHNDLSGRKNTTEMQNKNIS
jgi:hypothetical protein